MRLFIFDFVIKWLILVLEVTCYLNKKRLCNYVSPSGGFCNTISINDYYQRYACFSAYLFFHLEKFDSR